MGLPPLLFALLVVLVPAAPALAAERMTVVELFTSQGCSSCPAADAFLGELAQRPDVLALSEHVDYWDYLGWKDPFASRQNTLRQRDYARRLGLAYVYTPQMVVQGAWQAAGNDRPGVLRLLAAAAPELAVELHQTAEAQVVARLPAAQLPVAADVWLVRFEPLHVTRVTRGENHGRQLHNHNVVQDFVRLGSWSGEPLDLAIGKTNECRGCAVIVQQSDTGRILAAARVAPSMP